MKKKILTIGGATLDIFLDYQNIKTISFPENNKKNYLLLEEGSKIDLKKVDYFTGGGATNAAVSFKKLGFVVSSLIKIKNDYAGDFIINNLKKEGIDTSHAIYSQDLSTAISFVFPFPSGDRTVLAYRGANKDLKKNEIDLNVLKNFNHIYVTPLSGISAQILMDIAKEAKKNNVQVTVNPSMNQLQDNNGDEALNYFLNSLSYIDILILNSSEASALFETLLKDSSENLNFTIKEFFKLIMAKGPKIIAVTDGANGVHVAFENDIYFHPSLKIEKILNTLGAGDAFGSTFVASILNGESVEDSLVYGIINSAAVISNKGAKTGLLDLKTLNEKFKAANKEIIKIKLN